MDVTRTTTQTAAEIYLLRRSKKPLARDRLETLIPLAQAGDRTALEELVTANLRLVVSVVNKLPHPNSDREDLIAEGACALIRAIMKFDLARATQFSTYAAQCIRRAVWRYREDHGRTIRLPSNVHQEMHQLRKAEVALAQEHGQEPSEESVAKFLSISVDRVRWLRESASSIGSLNEVVSSDDSADSDAEFMEFVADPSPAPSFLAVGHDILDQALRALEDSEPREREILLGRFGIGSGEPLTCAELGSRHHLTRERIRQIQEVVLNNLRRILGSGPAPKTRKVRSLQKKLGRETLWA